MDDIVRNPAAETMRPTAPLPDKLRLVADDGRALDEMIESQLCQGWILLSRSYSLERGHRATLILGAMGQAVARAPDYHREEDLLTKLTDFLVATQQAALSSLIWRRFSSMAWRR